MIGQNTTERTLNFPKEITYVDSFPTKDKVWVFIMAGQSNMAGRGFVEPQDTLANSHIISINDKNKWIYAKEPLHFYQPNVTGLDCGLSFAKELKAQLNDEKITIALIPCAVGGSKIDVWLNDSIFNGVHLKSNFKEKVDLAKKKGVLKGILWLQGESNAIEGKTKEYKDDLKNLFTFFRAYTNDDSLPIIVGELGASPTTNEIRENYHIINEIIRDVTNGDKDSYLVHTEDLQFKADNAHFNSKSQRELGKRYAEIYIEILKNK
jgi:hypothetical protein